MGHEEIMEMIPRGMTAQVALETGRGTSIHPARIEIENGSAHGTGLGIEVVIEKEKETEIVIMTATATAILGTKVGTAGIVIETVKKINAVRETETVDSSQIGKWRRAVIGSATNTSIATSEAGAGADQGREAEAQLEAGVLLNLLEGLDTEVRVCFGILSESLSIPLTDYVSRDCLEPVLHG